MFKKIDLSAGYSTFFESLEPKVLQACQATQQFSFDHPLPINHWGSVAKSFFHCYGGSAQFFIRKIYSIAQAQKASEVREASVVISNYSGTLLEGVKIFLLSPLGASKNLSSKPVENKAPEVSGSALKNKNIQKPEIKLNFIKQEEGVYWLDLPPRDGKIKDNELLKFLPGQTPKKDGVQLVKDYIKKNAHAFPCSEDFRYQLFFLPEASKKNPAVEKFRRQFLYQVQEDIKELKAKIKKLGEEAPLFYPALLKDLELIAEEIPFTYFVASSQAPITTYFEKTGTLNLGAFPLMPTLLAEMDNRLIIRRVAGSWSVKRKVKCMASGKLVTLPKPRFLPDKSEIDTKYTFNLDHSELSYTIDHYDLWEQVFREDELGGEACPTKENKQAALASELRGALTEIRYIFFKLGYNRSEIVALMTNSEEKWLEFEKRLGEQMLDFSFASGGLAQDENFQTLLSQFRKPYLRAAKVYLRVVEESFEDRIVKVNTQIKDSRFVAKPGCVPYKP